MPCQECQRTAEKEWLNFSFDPEKKGFVCSFCRPKVSKYQRKAPLKESLISLVLLLICLLLLVYVSFWFGDFAEWKVEELAGPEPTTIEESGSGDFVHIVGQVNASQERVIYKEWNNQTQKKELRWENFSLDQENTSISVVTDEDSWVYQIEDREDGKPVDIRNGEELHVVGTIKEENGTLVLEVDHVYQGEYPEEQIKQTAIMFSLSLFVPPLVLLPRKLREAIPAFVWKLRKEGDKEKDGEGSGIEHLEEIRTLQRMGTPYTNSGKRLFDLFSLLSLSLFFFSIAGYYWLSLTMADEDNFGLLIILLAVPSFILATFLTVVLRTRAAQVSGIVIGEEGILISRETHEPYYLLWSELSADKLKELKDWDYCALPAALVGPISTEWQRRLAEEMKKQTPYSEERS